MPDWISIFTNWNALSSIGQLLGGMSLAVAAGTTFYIAFKVNDRNAKLDREMQERHAQARRSDVFRALYSQFWDSQMIAVGRRYITNDAEYEEIRPILERRNSCDKNSLSQEENDVLENIDKLCSILLRTKSYLEDGGLPSSQKELWDTLLWSYWTKKTTNRKELVEYIHKNWSTDLLELRVTQEPVKSRPEWWRRFPFAWMNRRG